LPQFLENRTTEYIATKIFDYLIQNLDDMDQIGYKRFNQYKLDHSVITIGEGKKLYEISVVELTEDEKVVLEVGRDDT
jgi:hypothetical protein